MKIKVNIYRMGYNGISSNSCDNVIIIIIKTSSAGPTGKTQVVYKLLSQENKKWKKILH